MFNPNDDSVADLLKRARTTHTSAPSNPFNPLDLSGLSAASNNFPTTGVPGSVAGRSNTEYGTNPNYGQQRQDLMSEIDFMMSGNPFNPLDTSGGQGDVSGNAFANNPHLGEGEWSGQTQQANPYAPGGSGHVPWVDSAQNEQFDAGLGVGNSLQDQSQWKIGGWDEPDYGTDWTQGLTSPNTNWSGQLTSPDTPWTQGITAPNSNPYAPGGNRYVPWDTSGNETDVGMGGDLFPQNTDFRGPSVPEGTQRQYAPSEDATRDDMGPLANNLERTTGDYDVSRKNQERMETKEAEAAKKLADEWAERYGLDDDAKKKEEEMIVEMQKIQNKQRIMYALAAFSGNQGLATMAGMVAQQDLAILEKKYGNETNQRMRDMQRSILFDKDGNYDPPESQEELYRALGSMGATPAEMDAISGQFDYSKDEAKGQNWWNEEQQRYEWTDTGNPPEGGGWVESGDVKKTDTASSGTGTKGAQAQELIEYQNAIRDADALGNTELAERLRNDYDVKRQLYGLADDAQTKDPTKSTTMINNKWKGILGNVTNSFSKEVDWEALSDKPPKGLGFPPPGGGEWTAQKFYDWFDQTYITESINNQVQQDPNNGVQDPVEMSRDEARLWLIENNEGITEDEIEAELNSAGY